MGRLLSLFLLISLRISAEISALYLTWYGDPTTTMAIQWHAANGEESLYLNKTGEEWTPVAGAHTSLNDVLIYRVFLEGLAPDSAYRFRIGEDPTVYTFRTAPNQLDKPLRFIIGGDAFQNAKLFLRMNETIASLDPLFCVIGGDIAYAINGTPFTLQSRAVKRWFSFLSQWKEQMVAPDGRLIPFLLAAGNHDIGSDNYETFFSLFAFPERQLYRAIDFGKYLSLILLDTGHFQPIEGKQTLWLDRTLANRADIPIRLAVYHEAAYPSFYPYNGETPKKIRTNWCPLFDKHKLPAAFEHHNHAFKRTYPIKNNALDPDGVLYLGDGCWGAKPRKTNDLWYLEKRARKNNVYLIDLSQESAQIQAIGLLGDTLDSVTLQTVKK